MEGKWREVYRTVDKSQKLVKIAGYIEILEVKMSHFSSR
jgi:hypothetical protein